MRIETFTIIFLCGLATGHVGPSRAFTSDNSTLDALWESPEFREAMKNVSKIEEFVKVVREITGEDLNYRDFGSDVRSGGKQALMATCLPELQTVEIPFDYIPVGGRVFPTCIRVKRCGGCCNSELLGCFPTKTVMTPYVVGMLTSDNNGKPKFQKVSVGIEEHLECDCSCRVQEKDCVNKWQKYDAMGCKCDCTNKDAYEKCEKTHPKTLWNYKNCTCYCANVKLCGEGFEFDHSTCECEKVPSYISYRPTTYDKLFFNDY